MHNKTKYRASDNTIYIVDESGLVEIKKHCIENGLTLVDDKGIEVEIDKKKRKINGLT